MPCLERCPECPSRNLPSWEQKKICAGTGPKNPRVMLVGEAPGKMEAQIGRPFVGKTGQELDNTYLPMAGLSRYDVWVDNAVKCHWADASDAPPPNVVKSCSEFHLRRDLERLSPEVLVLMGGISNGLLGLPLDITALHGTGRYGKLWGWEGKIWHSYHPALGMHMGSAMQSLLEDFRKLRSFIRGELAPLTDEYSEPVYITLRTRADVRIAMAERYADDIAVDTESRKTWKGTAASIRYSTWCATFCIDPGMAFMVKVEDAEAWDEFCKHLPKFRRIYMHNAPHDYRALLSTGCELDWRRILDTMDMAYVCANLPKGLKPLSYQLFGVTARGFDDVVRPYGIRAVMEYFEQASMIEWPAPEQEPTGEMETKKCPECGGTSVISSRLEVVCPECTGTGMVPGKKKLKKCPRCHGKLSVSIKHHEECPCGTGYVTVPKMTRKQGLGQKISRLITDYIKNGEDINPWERFENWGDCTAPLIETLGYPPLDSVELVPAREIEDYACLDAHSTRRAGPELWVRMRGIRKEYDHRSKD